MEEKMTEDYQNNHNCTSSGVCTSDFCTEEQTTKKKICDDYRSCTN